MGKQDQRFPEINWVLTSSCRGQLRYYKRFRNVSNAFATSLTPSQREQAGISEKIQGSGLWHKRIRSQFRVRSQQRVNGNAFSDYPAVIYAGKGEFRSD